MTEKLPFVAYIPPAPRKLVLGSFPCFNGNDYGDFFYSGSGRNHFWPLLSEITGKPAGTAAEKKQLCDAHGLALSDVALEIRRRLNNCSDSNLEILKYNRQGIHRCLAAGARHVFFTSAFVEHHFRRIFPGLDLPSTRLPSPSPAANRFIGASLHFKNKRASGEIGNVYEYRLAVYRELLFS